MINSVFMRSWMLLLILLVSAIAKAAPAIWQIVPSESSITFTATQNNAPVSGQFKTFNGEIVFDPAQLDASHIKIIVDVNSVSASYQQVADTLKTSSWFDVKDFPQAVYTANHFIKIGNNHFQAEGALSMHNMSVPTTLDFTLEKYTNHEALAKGSVTLKRTQFAIGNGEWAKTDSVKDDVVVDFVLSAKS